MNNDAIEREMIGRANQQREKRWLEVDYYRIRRKIAFPLALAELPAPTMPIKGIEKYPWAIWYTWALEERLLCLGWAGEWSEDESYRAIARREIAALASWPTYSSEKPDLPTAFVARLLVRSAQQWKWLGDDAVRAINGACARLIGQNLQWIHENYGPLRSVDDVLARENASRLVHNIPVMGSIGCALAAHHIDHPNAGEIDGRIALLIRATMKMREAGYTEAVAYDGFEFDFVCDWLDVIDETTRADIQQHPQWQMLSQQSIAVCAPGDALAVAELSDVEPAEMVFHVSMSAKMQRWMHSPLIAWYLQRCDIQRLRADTLATIHALPEDLAKPAPPAPGIFPAQYAVALRSGWERDDLALLISASTSRANHIHLDGGSIVIGSAGQWLLADPGYQQYMQTSEREFTVGPTAHNCPVINGQVQTKKLARVVASRSNAPDERYACIDITRNYDETFDLIQRHVWLIDKRHVILADVIRGDVARIDYHWHGHASAFWGARGDWSIISAARDLCFMTPHAPADFSQIHRLRGSRGHLTRIVSLPRNNAGVYWWVFSFDSPIGDVQLDGDVLRAGGRTFHPAK